MRISKLLGERLKNAPADATAKSHIYLMRAGYIKPVSTGIFTMLPPAQRVSAKIQQIIREEMDAVGGQECLFPVVMPREMWDASGRYSAIGNELLRFKDRQEHDMVLGMTHEEAATHAALNIIKSYDQLPFMIYQFQTKFRDEARPRAGLIRAREFIMKDAYSFHMTQEDLERYYKEVYDAYVRIFQRVGLKKFISVHSDGGAMGGKVADEFQLLTDIGEDTLVICPECDTASNVDVATGIMEENDHIFGVKQEIFTGEAKTIDEVCSHLNKSPKQCAKAVCYAVVGDSKRTIIVFIRGDRQVNETKLRALVGGEVAVKDLEDSGLVKGNIGCVDLPLKEGMEVYFDKSLEGLENFVTGANKEGYHYQGVSMTRDVKPEKFYDLSKVAEGDKCPICGAKLVIKNGIEIANIFQLGTKYTSTMGLTVHDENGNLVNPIMGCYGIGIGRLIASLAEESSDDKGLSWPMSVAPWHIYLCPLKMSDERVKAAAEKLYKRLTAENFEVLYDDRDTSAGIKLTDSELMGIPVRIVISPKTLEEGTYEITLRATGEKIFARDDNLTKKLDEIIVY